MTLRPELEAATFTGEVVITVVVSEAVETISLNAAELVVATAAVKAVADAAPWTPVAAITLDTPLERVHLRLAAPLAPGTYHVRATFSGTLNDNMAGFYRSEYLNAAGEKRNMAVTQFEATDARKAFPCWDEPARKAIFQVRAPPNPEPTPEPAPEPTPEPNPPRPNRILDPCPSPEPRWIPQPASPARALLSILTLLAGWAIRRSTSMSQRTASRCPT